MCKHKRLFVLGVLVALAMLVQVAPVTAGPCGFPTPCTHDVTGFSIGLDVDNLGDGVAINGYSHGSDGITAQSDAIGKSGVYSFNTTDSGYGVFGAGWFGGYGVYGKSPTHGVGGEGAVGVYGLSDGTHGVFGENTNANGGYGVYGKSPAYGVGGEGQIGVYGKSDGAHGVIGQNTNAKGGFGVTGTSTNGISGYFYNTNSANAKPSLKATTKGKGWAAQFTGSGPTSKGVYISTKPGSKGLQVAGGTKSAVVATSQGARSLYAEEASEVYFTDYGFGRLKDGQSTIAIDSLFAETVNLEKDYYVFLQPYGEAELYVSATSPKSFEVRLRTKDTQGDANVKFAYRIVGKRRGFEQTRLEHAQWADSDPNLYPAKPTEKVAAKK
jgi:hypothetical protein